MAYAGWTAVIQDDRGNIQPGATVEVRNINTGSLAVLYADRMGTVGLGNPFQADSEGYATFFAKGAEYRITATRGAWTTEWPYVAVGTTQGVDLSDLALGLDYDAQVNTLPERDAYDGEPEGFSVLVSDVGDGRGAVYTRTDVPGEWSDPAFITGTPGPATNISIGTVDTVDYGEGSSATMTGASPAQTLNLELERGAPGRIENFRGSYDAGEPYASGDIVESGGSLYMAMVADPTAAPPSAGWELFLPGSSVADGAVTEPKLSDGAVSISKTDGTYARVTFDTVAQLLTGVVAGKTLGYSTGLVVSPGDIIEAQGFRYEVAASGATDEHVETAGGVKLYVIFDKDDYLHTAALGATGMGVDDETELLRRALSIHPHIQVDGWLRITETIILPSPTRMRGNVAQSITNPIAQGSSRIVASRSDLLDAGVMFRTSPVGDQSHSLVVEHMQFVGDADIDPANLHLAVDEGIYAFDLSGLKNGGNFNNCYFRGLRKAAYADGDPYTDQIVFNQCFFTRNYMLVDFRNSAAGTAGIAFNQCMAYENIKFVNAFYDVTFSDCSFQNSSYTAVRNDIIADNILWDGGWLENLIQPFQPRRSATVRALRCGELGAPPGSGESKFIFRAANGVTIRYIGSRIPTGTRFCTFLGVSDLSTVTIEMIGAYKTAATDGGFGDTAGITNYLGQINYRGIGNTNRPEWNYTGKRRITVSGNYTITRGDEGCFIRSTATSNSTITIPSEATYIMPIGGEIEIVNDGAGDITITATGATIRNLSTSQESRTLSSNGTALLRKSAGNIWHIIMN